MSLTTSENGAATLSRERLYVSLEALCEIEVLAGMLPGLVPEDEHDAHYAVRGFAVTVQANWRLSFRFVGEDVELLDHLDYH